MTNPIPTGHLVLPPVLSVSRSITPCLAASGVSKAQRVTLAGRRCHDHASAAISVPEISHGVFRSASGCWLTIRKRATRSCEVFLLDRDMARASRPSPDVRRDYDRSPAALAASNAVGAPAFCSSSANKRFDPRRAGYEAPGTMRALMREGAAAPTPGTMHKHFYPGPSEDPPQNGSARERLYRRC